MTEAHWALIGVIIGGVVTGIINYFLQRNQFKHNKEMFLLKNKIKETVKDILTDMMWHKVHIDRSFAALKKRIGGYSENEIRQILHEIGALKAIRSEDQSEWWYWKERQEERIERRKNK